MSKKTEDNKPDGNQLERQAIEMELLRAERATYESFLQLEEKTYLFKQKETELNQALEALKVADIRKNLMYSQVQKLRARLAELDVVQADDTGH